MSRYAKANFKYAKEKNKNVKANLKNAFSFSDKRQPMYTFTLRKKQSLSS